MALASLGCGQRGGVALELRGPEALARLPREAAELIPEDSILCLDEARRDGAYRLWILRRPGGAWLSFAEKAKRAEQHRMPSSALEAVLRTRLPSLESGRPLEPHCRFTHWKLADGAEIQVRELITERGWFASVERVAM
jgi:hypothetical protein